MSGEAAAFRSTQTSDACGWRLEEEPVQGGGLASVSASGTLC